MIASLNNFHFIRLAMVGTSPLKQVPSQHFAANFRLVNSGMP